jgi:hypothetical protein
MKRHKSVTSTTKQSAHFCTTDRHTGINAARAAVRYGISNLRPGLGCPDPPVSSIKRRLVVPGGTVPHFIPQATAKTPSEIRKSFCNPTDGDAIISEFDRKIIREFLKENLLELKEFLRENDLDPGEAYGIILGLK